MRVWKQLQQTSCWRAWPSRAGPVRDPGHAGDHRQREVCPGCIFVAFPGEKFDGHDFAAKALENGALCVVLNHPVEGVPEEKSVICPDSYHAMMVLGANYRSQFHPKWWA